MKHFLCIILLLLSCSCRESSLHEYEELSKYEQGEEYLTGKFSTPISGRDAFGVSFDGLNKEQVSSFGRGNSLFRGSFSKASGLGPLLNAQSCANCHFKDGRGRPLQGNTDNERSNFSRGFLMRLSTGNNPLTGPVPDDIYGGQLQDRGLLEGINIAPEAKVRVLYKLIKGKYPDGTTYELQKPNYEFYDVKFKSLHGLKMSPRVGTQTIGLGFVDALSEEEILKNADEFDTDEDGISGKANYVLNERGVKAIGKFGWKANVATLVQQVAGAFNGDMGITSPLFPKQNIAKENKDVYDYFSKNGGDNVVDITQDQLDDIVFYQATLSVPIRRNVKEQNVLAGKLHFGNLKCMGCHKTNFKVEVSKMIPLINGTKIHPYSDFLLHDMGAELADNSADFLASGNEWRTMPLWGIGLIGSVNKHTNFLHDGRARNFEEAILWHGGEAESSKNEFMNLSKKGREELIEFLKSL